ncbi:glycosyl transferase family 2 [Mycobacterium sp. BK558]|nr:glycosyl transferase family 2 [Mycobacterium sp. BK558]
MAAHTEDRWDDIRRAIDSVLVQHPQPLEVILSVDHNTALANRARAEFTGVIVVENTGPRGASATRNTGVAHATGEIVVFLDDDQSAAEPGWLATLCRHFDDATVVGVGGGIVPDWPGRRPRWFPGEFDWVVGTSYLGMPTSVAPIRNVWGGNSAIRRSTFDAAGGFRAGFGKTGTISRPEDTDFCLRVSQAVPTGRWLYDPAAAVIHRVPAERTTRRYFLTRCWQEGRGKAALVRFVGPEANESERTYTTRVLPVAVLRELRAGVFGGQRAAFERCAALVVGFTVTVAGFMVEMVAGLHQGRR